MHNSLKTNDTYSKMHPLAPVMLIEHLLVENLRSSVRVGGPLGERNINRWLTGGLRRAVVAIVVLFFIGTGCSNSAFAADAGQSTGDTIFGRLSQRFQLGSTEEVITYKLPVGPYFATIRGEVLLGRPAYLDVVLNEQESGTVRSDLDVLIELCQIADETVNQVESCVDFDGPRYQYVLEAKWQGSAYRADGFIWDTDGNWHGVMTMTDPATGEVEVVDIWPYVYPTRPASTNLFELVSIILPFVALGLFLVGRRVVNGRFALQQG